jgi:hypothetical protein
MARTLDALDAALNNPASTAGQEAQKGQQGQQTAQNAQGQPQPGQPNQQGQPQPAQQGQPQQQSQAMAQAQSAMQQAAQAAQQAMQQARAQEGMQQPGEPPMGDQQEKSLAGANAQGPGSAYGAIPDARNLKPGDWGKLPKQMVEQLTRGQGEAVPAEYRNQVETYYRVIAERAKKQ